MRDGSDAIADWPLLNAMLTSPPAPIRALHNGGGRRHRLLHACGQVVVLDGSELADEKARRVFSRTWDGVVRHVDRRLPRGEAGGEGEGECGRRWPDGPIILYSLPWRKLCFRWNFSHHGTDDRLAGSPSPRSLCPNTRSWRWPGEVPHPASPACTAAASAWPAGAAITATPCRTAAACTCTSSPTSTSCTGTGSTRPQCHPPLPARRRARPDPSLRRPRRRRRPSSLALAARNRGG